MPRRHLLVLASAIASLVLAACSNPTGPSDSSANNGHYCQVSVGSGTCK